MAAPSRVTTTKPDETPLRVPSSSTGLSAFISGLAPEKSPAETVCHGSQFQTWTAPGAEMAAGSAPETAAQRHSTRLPTAMNLIAIPPRRSVLLRTRAQLKPLT
jgi:hypothetical protein